MGRADVDQRQARFELALNLGRQFDAIDSGVRVVVHVDEVDPAECGGDLILNAALLMQEVGLHTMCRGSQFMFRQPAGSQPIHSADHGDCDGCRGSRGTARRCVACDGQLQRLALRRWHEIQNCLDQRMPAVVAVGLVDAVALVVIARVDGIARRVAIVSEDAELDLDRRRDCDVEYLAMPREPGIGPSAVVTDADGRPAVDHAQRLSRIGHESGTIIAAKVRALPARERGPYGCPKTSAPARRGGILFQLSKTRQVWALGQPVFFVAAASACRGKKKKSRAKGTSPSTWLYRPRLRNRGTREQEKSHNL